MKTILSILLLTAMFCSAAVIGTTRVQNEINGTNVNEQHFGKVYFPNYVLQRANPEQSTNTASVSQIYSQTLTNETYWEMITYGNGLAFMGPNNAGYVLDFKRAVGSSGGLLRVRQSNNVEALTIDDNSLATFGSNVAVNGTFNTASNANIGGTNGMAFAKVTNELSVGGLASFNNKAEFPSGFDGGKLLYLTGPNFLLTEGSDVATLGSDKVSIQDGVANNLKSTNTTLVAGVTNGSVTFGVGNGAHSFTNNVGSTNFQHKIGTTLAYSVDMNGRVGIGTATPTNTLNVVGSFALQGSQTNSGGLSAAGDVRAANIYSGWPGSGVSIIGAYVQFQLGSLMRDRDTAGTFTLMNSGANGMRLLQFGGTDASFPALGRTNGWLRVMGADGLFGSTATNGLIVDGGIVARAGASGTANFSYGLGGGHNAGIYGGADSTSIVLGSGNSDMAWFSLAGPVFPQGTFIGFVTNGATLVKDNRLGPGFRMNGDNTIWASNNFGIWTNAPNAALHVAGNNALPNVVQFGTTNKPNMLVMNTNGVVTIGTDAATTSGLTITPAGFSSTISSVAGSTLYVGNPDATHYFTMLNSVGGSVMKVLNNGVTLGVGSGATAASPLLAGTNGHVRVAGGDQLLGSRGTNALLLNYNVSTTSGTATNSNTQRGRVRIVAGSQSYFVTNTLVNANAFALATVNTDDATAFACKAIPSAGLLTLKLNGAAAADVDISWEVQPEY